MSEIKGLEAEIRKLFAPMSPVGNSDDVLHVSQGLSGKLDILSGNLYGLSGNLDGLSAGSASGQEIVRMQLLERLTPSRHLLVNNLGQRRSPEAMKAEFWGFAGSRGTAKRLEDLKMA